MHLESETNFPNIAAVTGFCFKFNFLYSITAKNEGKKSQQRKISVFLNIITNMIIRQLQIWSLEEKHFSLWRLLTQPQYIVYHHAYPI